MNRWTFVIDPSKPRRTKRTTDEQVEEALTIDDRDISALPWKREMLDNWPVPPSPTVESDHRRWPWFSAVPRRSADRTENIAR